MEKMSVSLERELLEWLEDQVREGRFKSISAGIRECVRLGMYSAPIDFESVLKRRSEE